MEEQHLLTSIRQEYHQSKGTYGSPRLHRELLKAGIRIGRHRLVPIMRKYEITARPLKRFRVTTDSDHELPVAQNVLNRQFHAEAPDTKWTCDITYVVRHEVACKIVMRSIPDMTGCPITRTLRGNAARQRAV